MQTEPRFRDRLRYWLDGVFSRGPIAMIAALTLFSLVIILLVAMVLTITGFAQEGGSALNFPEAFWEAMMRTFDAGTMGGDTGWGFRFVMLVDTIGGIFVISALIGVLTTGIETRMEELRKGRSRVIESGHTVILGWSEQVFTIMSELAIANENQPKSCVVLLGDKDKVEMEDELHDKVLDDGRKLRIVCRTGSPMDMSDLDLVSLNTAKSIIVVSPDTEEPDSEVIKAVLAITHHPNRRPEPYTIVAEIRDEKNMAAARVVGKNEVEWVLVGDLIARIIAQTCRQSGLSVVYTELLDFGGDEIYFKAEPSLAGKTFGEALHWFETNSLLGLMTAKQEVKLNPPMDTVLQKTDQLILVAEDDDKIFLNSTGPGAVSASQISSLPVVQKGPEEILVLGWNWRGRSILRELDNYVAPGSLVELVADENDIQDAVAETQSDLSRLSLQFKRADITDRRVLDNLNLGRFKHIILLCYSDSLKPQQADAATLITLLHLRDIADIYGYSYSIVSEMLDIRNRNLADVTRADDFIVSDKLVSLMMAQVSENRHLNAVFKDFFDPEGSEIYLKPACNYVAPGQPVNFYTLVEAARRKGEVAMGYRLAADSKDASKAYGVHLNPRKSSTFTLGEHDSVVVLAED
jgi:ion channel POLLUX/CASTOR